ncbi:MAG: hypothetical protein AAF307_02380 [Pseudomonadota bacterium]
MRTLLLPALFCAFILVGARYGFAQVPPPPDTAVAFAKFSPLPIYEDATVEALDGSIDVEFAAPLNILKSSRNAVLISHNDSFAWVKRADLFLPHVEQYLETGRGLRQRVRPNMRFWRSGAVLAEFLSNADLSNAQPDFEEVQGPDRTPPFRLPIMWSDVADVMGNRSVELAGVLLPFENRTLEDFEEIAGKRGVDGTVFTLVDVSPDAVSFSEAAFVQLRRRVTAALGSAAERLRFRVIGFGANVNGSVDDLGVLPSGATLASAVRGLRAPDGHSEPLLDALHTAQPLAARTSGKNLVLVLSGADLRKKMSRAGLSRSATLAQPQLDFGPDTSLVFAKITPEPGRDLFDLSRRTFGTARASYIPFSAEANTLLFRSVERAFGIKDESTLSEEEIKQACAPLFAAAKPCILPHAPSSNSIMPKPTRRARNADWYATVVWTVRDGELFTKPNAAN